MSLQIVEWDDFSSSQESAMTIGVFDGVHRGHQELIKRVVRHGTCPTVVTFRENPRKIISPGRHEGDIFSLKQKLAVFERLGVARVVLIDFSEKFSKISGREFLYTLEQRGKMVFLTIGSNFHCGYRNDTKAVAIKEMYEGKKIPIEVVEPVLSPAGRVSSSLIRAEINSGNLDNAAALLGRNVELDLADLRSVDLRSADLRSVDLRSADLQSVEAQRVYDLRGVHRMVPGKGVYPVMIHPEKVPGKAVTENGLVYLSGAGDRPVECLEFLTGFK